MRRRKARRKSKDSDQTESLGQRMIFCTECGENIENFCLSGKANDLRAIRKTLAQCKSNGRFKGEFCSKLFIAHPDAFNESESDD